MNRARYCIANWKMNLAITAAEIFLDKWKNKALNNHQPNFLNNYNSLHNLPVMLYCYMKNRKNLLKIVLTPLKLNP